jgi:putative transposase
LSGISRMILEIWCFYSTHYNATKFASSKNNVFSSKGIEILNTPHRAPRANAFAERWEGSIREECLDHILVLNEHHFHSILRENGEFYSHARPRQEIGQRFPISVPRREQRTKGPIQKDILAGVTNDYYRQASASVSSNG